MTLPRFLVVIPARLASTRLPNKPLADIAGLPMVVRVAQQAQQSAAAAVWVATDHPDIVATCEAHQVPVRLTASHHPSGTDRLAEVVEQLHLADDEIIINVQGDEPLLPPALIDELATCLAAQPNCVMATLAHPILHAEEFFNPNVVKVVCSEQGQALYFSRAPIPWARDAFMHQPITVLPKAHPALRHIGIYAYRAGFLRQYQALSPSQLEQWEALEQLRVLAHGFAIAVKTITLPPPAGVDTPEDLARVRAFFATQHTQ